MADVTESSNNSDQNNEVSSPEPDISCNNGDTITNLESENSNIGKIAIQLSTPRNSSSNFTLRTSLLGSTPGKAVTPGTPGRTFVLNPPRLSNPFAKSDKTEETEQNDKIKKELDKNIENSSSPKKSEETKHLSPLNKTSVAFVPLCGEQPAAPSGAAQPFTQPSTPSLGFVFGQNIHEKVEATSPGDSGNTVSDPVGAVQESEEAKTNGTTSEMLFSSTIKKDSTDKIPDTGGKTLSEAAREYEEARAVKRKYEAVQVLTGEEEEANVLQINCKLFSWSSYNWVERGRGTLRVNDVSANPPQHRLIVRTAGSLRLVLNTKIWAGMTVDKASNKSMRITAMDSNGVVKVFLLMASPKEIEQLQKCLEWRVNSLKKFEEGQAKKSKDDTTS